MSVQVGVRVRPFNKREEQLNSRLCVQMEGKTTTLIDSEGQKKSFHYDHSFWSHDGFHTDEEGYSHPIDDRYADQRKVYDLIGSSILTNAWEGYNCCLFAYGQTGSGKSYSMIGYGANKGLIPIICNSIFEKISHNQDGTRSFEVKISMLEIYNEAVKDLLSKSKKQDLKICEHKTLGVYVDGLEKFSVDSYEKIQKKIEEGSHNRSIAATLMNQSSSRSHTIVSINFVQKIQVSMEQTSVKYSMIHLVDLAGSECVGKTGVDSKDRLRQTAKINQSLTTLGRVIEILAENCNKKEKDKLFVPYRDSKLTFILRNALGGNSCTAMICAISPSDDNYEQTLSTLRYASRAKKIQNKAIVNQSDVDKLIRLLREENEMLKKMLQEARTNKVAVNEEMISNFNQTKKMVDLAVEDTTSKGKEEEQQILSELEKEDIFDGDEATVNFSINDSFSIAPAINGINEDLPYLTNLSEDQLLSFRIKYSCEKLNIGNKKGNPKPDVILTSLGIQANHAFISYDSDARKCFIELLDDNASNYTFINGQTIPSRGKEEIFHLDRIIFGTGCLFILIFKDSPPRNEKLKLEDIDYEFAMNQMQTSNIDKSSTLQIDDKAVMIEEQELRKKIITQIQENFENIKKQNEQEMKKQIEERERDYHLKIKELQEIKEKEAKKLLSELEARTLQSKRLEDEKKKIKEQVDKILTQTTERAKREEIEKKQLEATKSVLKLKEKQIEQLEQKMAVIKVETEEKSNFIKTEIKKQEDEMKKELQMQTIICHNANIIAQYQLQVNKRTRNAKEVKDLLIKKEKIELQKQLVDLVPLVERFNLMAKEMSKRIECGLSIEYKYISEAEIIEVLKNNTYKSKLKILIHVINRDEGRSYYWDTTIFRNRFEHTLEYFDNYIKLGKNFKYTREEDPYWDPEKFETIACTHITLETLLFNISFNGDIAIISHSKKIGKIHARLYQTDRNGAEDLSLDNPNNQTEYRLINPHEQIEKTIYFILQLDKIDLIQGELQEYDQMKLEYYLLDNYKRVKFQSEIIPKIQIQNYKYRKLHMLRELSQAAIVHYLQNPISIDIQVIQRVATADELTHRSSFTSNSVIKSSFSMQLEEEEARPGDAPMITEFTEVSPPRKSIKLSALATSPLRNAQPTGVIYENTEITKRVEEEYQRKKKEQMNNQSNQINMKKNKDGNKSIVVQPGKSLGKDSKNPKECEIY